MKRKLLWAAAIIVVLVIIAGIAGGGSESEAEKPTATTGETEPATTTTSSTTTTTAAPTTTVSAREIAEAMFVPIFEESRAALIEGFSAMSDVQSVDKFIYDPTSKTIVLDVTSNWSAPDNQVEGAWNVTKALSEIWEPFIGNVGFVPNFELVNSGARYACPAAFMVQLANVEAGKNDWLAACG